MNSRWEKRGESGRARDKETPVNHMRETEEHREKSSHDRGGQYTQKTTGGAREDNMEDRGNRGES